MSRKLRNIHKRNYRFLREFMRPNGMTIACGCYLRKDGSRVGCRIHGDIEAPDYFKSMVTKKEIKP